MEYYIHHMPVFVVETPTTISIPEFCAEAEHALPARLLSAVDVIYIGQFRELQGRNAAFLNGAIYMMSTEPTIHDMIENYVHETAHSLESTYGAFIYDDELIQEFKGKRTRLRGILEAHGYKINPILYGFTEYNQRFDEFLAEEVGYPTLLTLTMGLFASPYGATSIQEYFANGFEKYYLENPRSLRNISPVLFRKIEEIINDKT